MEMKRSDPFSYLHRTGIMSSGIAKGGDRALKVKSVTMAVKRPPEFPSRTPSGPRDGHPPVKGSKMPGDGWKPGKNPPARSGPETLGGMAASPGGNKARSASPAKGVETQSAKHDPPNTAKRVGAKRAKIEPNESAAYEAAERRAVGHFAKESVLREGHNTKSGGKVEATMHEFKRGKLHSGSKKGPKVTSRKQAVAIGLSQARKAGEKVAPPKKKR